MKSNIRRAATVLLLATAPVVLGASRCYVGTPPVVDGPGTAVAGADPHVVRANGFFYLFTTGHRDPRNPQVGDHVPVWRSSDLVTWNRKNDALAGGAPWADGDWRQWWAPGVIERGGTYLLYFTAPETVTGLGRKCIGVATSSSPEEPFVARSRPIVCHSFLGGRGDGELVKSGGAIDPFPFEDGAGRLWLLYKHDIDVVTSNTVRLEAVQLRSSGLRTQADAPTAKILFVPNENGNGIERWEGLGPGYGPYVENPAIHKVGPRWWLFYSGNRWTGPEYATGMALCPKSLKDMGPSDRCVSSTGEQQPWLAATDYDENDNQEYDPPVHDAAFSGAFGIGTFGPGGLAPFEDGAGRTWAAYHGWGIGDRVVFVHCLLKTEQNEPTLAATVIGGSRENYCQPPVP